MTAASSARLEMARRIARLYSAAPSVRAMMVFGSVARGTADEYSDLDVCVFWRDPPTDPQREASFARARLRLLRAYPFRALPSDPARETGLDVCSFAEPQNAGLTVRLSHRTVPGTDKLVADVLEKGDLWWEKHATMGSLIEGVPVHGDRTILDWKARAAQFPDGLARAVVERHLSVLADHLRLLCPERAAVDFDLLVEIVARVGGVLAAVNGIYVETDRIRLKTVRAVLGRIVSSPPDVAVRIDRIFRADAAQGVEMTRSLVEETLGIASARFPEIDAKPVRESLGRVAGSWAP